MTIKVKANAVMLEDMNGKLIRLPRSYGMLHDPEGTDFARCDVYFGPYKMTRAKAPMDSSAKWYFGRTYEAKGVRIDGLRLDGPWKHVAGVRKIFYYRRGVRAPGGFHHAFHRSPLELSKCGKFYKLTLPGGCIVDDRGFVWP